MEATDFNSSNLKNGAYDEEAEELMITFNNGATYRYSGVPVQVWIELKMASSAGQYFSANVRNVFPNERIG